MTTRRPGGDGLPLWVLALILLVGALGIWGTGRPPPIRPSADDPSLDLRIDINSAAAHELAALPGVGDVLARRIVEHRDQWGDFASLEAVLRVEGVGRATLSKMSAHLLISGVTEAQ